MHWAILLIQCSLESILLCLGLQIQVIGMVSSHKLQLVVLMLLLCAIPQFLGLQIIGISLVNLILEIGSCSTCVISCEVVEMLRLTM